MRLCARCGADIEHRDRRSRHCGPLCRDRDYENAAAGTVRCCLWCGDEFAPTKGTHVYCKKDCRDRADVDRNREEYNRRNAERRARERGARTCETFTRDEIFDRDGWICQLCFTPIDWRLVGRVSGAPTIDHVTPLIHGGQHTRVNVQAAHMSCNARKRDHLGVVAVSVPGDESAILMRPI